jgi:putative oxidoreductase
MTTQPPAALRDRSEASANRSTPAPGVNLVVTILYDWSRIFAGYLGWAAPLAARIVVGWVFLWSGWHKLQVVPRMVENFREWGIPAPEVMAPFVSGMEFVGGLLLLAGLLTRFVSVPMMIIMIVAIASARWSDVDSLESLLGFEEVSYFVLFAWIGIAGPGPVSLDHLVLRAFRKGTPPSVYGA